MNKSGKRRSAGQADYGAPLFSETLYPSFSVLVFIYFLFASFSLALWAALGNTIGALSLLLFSGLILWIRRIMSLSVRVTKGWLVVGPAAIERAFIRNCQVLTPLEMSKARGISADPAAYLQIRFWVKGGVKIDLRDPKDPTPYWLVSSQNGDVLAKALSPKEH